MATSRRDREQAAATPTDWAAAEVVTRPRRATVVHSTRVPADLSEALEAEAVRRGVTPSALIAEFVAEGLRRPEPDVLVPLADVRRVIDSLASRTAAA
ncbi:hypothetical protein [Dactylosporangium fulvum]|uniref:Ribbon-helix-helix protein CopG domain-containing protein n=1 Tax=Dactylosporangium fulvum TaxID=53359 RepID=A0ABY5VN51_9ACTN|nr:hypothetical protein [Dactylosporangium fulvum]UWP79157.1 hypothetical protein Dfulv_28770 [Dactylosporangium fulvum]